MENGNVTNKTLWKIKEISRYRNQYRERIIDTCKQSRKIIFLQEKIWQT